MSRYYMSGVMSKHLPLELGRELGLVQLQRGHDLVSAFLTMLYCYPLPQPNRIAFLHVFFFSLHRRLIDKPCDLAADRSYGQLAKVV